MADGANEMAMMLDMDDDGDEDLAPRRTKRTHPADATNTSHNKRSKR